MPNGRRLIWYLLFAVGCFALGVFLAPSVLNYCVVPRNLVADLPGERRAFEELFGQFTQLQAQESELIGRGQSDEALKVRAQRTTLGKRLTEQTNENIKSLEEIVGTCERLYLPPYLTEGLRSFLGRVAE